MRILSTLVLAAAVAGGVLVPSFPAAAATGPLPCSAQAKSPGELHLSMKYAITTVIGRNGNGHLFSGTTPKLREYYWTKGTGLRGGDQISLDWSKDKGKTYHSCRVTLDYGRSVATTKAVVSRKGYYYRSCVKTNKWECSEWVEIG